ncbi:MAG: carbamoyltransferase [Gaiellales bacterium]|nr:carbamoyltransferase [Gaiellales bacterium]
MNIIGINCAFHDSTVCVLQEGLLTVAIEEERLTRQKHTSAFPYRAFARCLETAGLAPADIDHVAVSMQPGVDWHRKAAYGLKSGKNLMPFLRAQVLNLRHRQRSLSSWISASFPSAVKPTLHFVPHHVAHAAGSFLVSPYESAALLSVDGSGEWATTFKGVGRANTYECLGQDYFPVSLGEVYEAATEFCGFKMNCDEGKTMGLAPLGDPDVFGEAASKVIWVNEDMSLQVDLSYFDYPRFGSGCGRKFYETFGQPRNPDREPGFEQHHLDVAAAFQKQAEECILAIARKLRERTREDYLVISGGVALNSVANGRVVRESGFKDVYVMPAAGDNGTAIGAAYVCHNHILGRPRAFVHDDPYVGTQYSKSAIRRALDECKLEYRMISEEKLEPTAARLLQSGHILGWFQGRMEIGPRALGNRSILANPTVPDMKDRINAEVKHREAFRPFAPSCPVEDAPRFFEQNVADPFMLKVCYVRPEMRDVLPAITHVDGTARLQTVHADINSRYHKLHKEFEKLSGVPVLLNTSFNVMGEPIVESPIDAIRCFFATGLDFLVLDDYLVAKPMHAHVVDALLS